MNTCESTRARRVGWSGRLADDESILSLSEPAREVRQKLEDAFYPPARPLVRGVVAPLFSSVKPLLLLENTAVSRINSVGRNPQTPSCLPSHCFGPVRTFYLYPLWSCCRHSLIYRVSEYRCVAFYRISSVFSLRQCWYS